MSVQDKKLIYLAEEFLPVLMDTVNSYLSVDQRYRVVNVVCQNSVTCCIWYAFLEWSPN